MKRLVTTVLLAFPALLLLSYTPVQASGKNKGEKKRLAKAAGKTTAQDELVVTVTQLGPAQAEIDALMTQLPNRPTLAKALDGGNFRLLSCDFLENFAKNNQSLPPTRYRANFYNYASNFNVHAEGNIDGSGTDTVIVDNDQPPPSPEEYQYAVSLLREADTFGLGLKEGSLLASQAMPPVLEASIVDGIIERTINIQLLTSGGKSKYANEVVGVNLVRNKFVRYQGGAPPTSRAAPQACGVPDSGQQSSGIGVAGQFQFTVQQNGATLWNFIVNRPSSSSGTNVKRSGVELRNVMYKGKMVLKRIHTPILNVRYVADACGPYRDWQYQEDMFQANGTDVAPGVRDCGTNIATTALETGNDTGNFRGVAFYRQGNEVVLVSEMQAGWYRYVNEYRLANDGTIRPRYGYGATDDSCVCAPHVHHVYWRMDFDIGAAANNVIRPSRREFAWGNPYTNETKLFRSSTARQNWLVQNRQTLDSYMIRPNSNDGYAQSQSDGGFSAGDLWLLKYHSDGSGNPTEIDDGFTGVTCSVNNPLPCSARLDNFVTGEALTDDIVVWYGAHFLHNDGGNNNPDITGPNILTGTHVHGPDLVPARW